jgi:hypothetical protein
MRWTGVAVHVGIEWRILGRHPVNFTDMRMNSTAIRLLVCSTLAVSCVATATTRAEPAHKTPDVPPINVETIPRFDELLDWVAAVRRDDFSLVKATRQNGYFIAIFKTGDGDLAFCRSEIGAPRIASSLTVEDTKGQSVRDINAPQKRAQRILLREYRVTRPNVKFSVLVHDGEVLPIIKMPPQHFRVKFAVSKQTTDTTNSGEPIFADQVVFDELVEWK